MDPAEGENVGGTAVPPETSVFIEQISQPGTRPGEDAVRGRGVMSEMREGKRGGIGERGKKRGLYLGDRKHPADMRKYAKGELKPISLLIMKQKKKNLHCTSMTDNSEAFVTGQ